MRVLDNEFIGPDLDSASAFAPKVGSDRLISLSQGNVSIAAWYWE
jgi:hypothetical protein